MGSRDIIKFGYLRAQGVATRLRGVVDKETRFMGAYPTRELALAALPPEDRKGYDCDDIVDVCLAEMCEVQLSDYPVVLWLERLIREQGRLSLVDAGGHIGTKYRAFKDQLELEKFDWSIWDMPALIKAGRQGQADGKVAPELRFIEDLAEAGEVDVLFASGLLQFLDISFTQLLDQMAKRPKWVILNKVATRPNDELTTLELVGTSRVPYQMRHRGRFEDELRANGYTIRDSWTVPWMSHTIGTHPWLGTSTSVGYVLERL